MDHATLVFASVFPVPSLSHTTPTPVATPDLGFTGPGSSFGSPYVANAGGTQHRAARRNLAWSTATRFLSLPKNTADAPRRTHRSSDVEEALSYLLVGEGASQDGEEGLADWYANEARLHFANHVKQALLELWNHEIDLRNAWEVLEETQRVLEQVQNLYHQPFHDHILPFIEQAAANVTIRASRSSDELEVEMVEAAKRKLQRDMHAAFAHTLPSGRLSKTLSYMVYDAACKRFRLHIRQDGLVSGNTEPEDAKEVTRRMTILLMGLERVGLGKDSAQRALAHAMNKVLDTYVASHYLKVDWYSRQPVTAHLRQWVESGFIPLSELFLTCLKCEPASIALLQRKQWQEMALTRLGRSRAEDLFDFVTNWDQSLGAILDLKEYLRLDGAKEHLKGSFSRQVSRRLLHPGATTAYILNVYICIIRAFHRLEPKGVILQSVARPIRKYLKEREDTARIIISSLLVDLKDENSVKLASVGEVSFEIASEMAKPFYSHAEDADEEASWNDMSWQPPPYDAPPEYKKSKMEDVIYFLLTLWDRDDFINELKNILGDHLLKCQDPEFQKEIRLLELIKIRLGEDKLQACEVMLRDVLESRRINESIRTASDKSQEQPPQTPESLGPRTPRPRRPAPSAPRVKPASGPALNAQILSSFFWPILRDETFRVPAQIETLQQEYESRFESIKGMRKLRWMNALGDSCITLEFDDRTEEFEHLTSWQVSVVCAFQPQPGEEWVGKGKDKAVHAFDPQRDEDRAGDDMCKSQSESITRNMEQLEEMLEMDESLVHQALAFWVGKSVLREVSPNTYAVIERLDSSTKDSDAAAAAQELAEVQAAQTTTVKSQADLLNERKDVYMTFITGMLTNQGNLPLKKISFMMGMMIQGGFPFGDAELEGLLTEMESNGKVVPLGGNIWGIRK
ncbi:anaphase-promoting complex subunit Apc2 [Bimuria novae-zelandiae CBS 107.79]|uniref:Anaphase-promoting complex subunit 2 n=1 Tax=Bimuria novae-zelandiae CBS 107.79 TaxID=1447943 RepID=A0A6A5V8Z5_9PLEO|nr:anaphase-promoting complex subunit Apc2 [Bimuria novae-zelandiae CBS 107.79]